MKSKEPEYRAAYWKRWATIHRPSPRKDCSECGDAFFPHGPQQRCNKCRASICPQCGMSFMTNVRRRKFCGRRCLALAYIATLHANRGKKPRTFYSRNRNKHGSAEEREWRLAVFVRDNYVCLECGARGGKLSADHIEPWWKRPDLRFELSNGRTLCRDCHRKTPTYGWRGYWMRRREEIAAKRLAQECLFTA